jgi:hypothetical protein
MMRSIFDLQAAPETSQNPWNKRVQDGAKEAEVTRSVAALGTRLDELRHAEAGPKSAPAEPQERNPQMAQETQRARAAAAGAAASTSGGMFSPTAAPDGPKQASETRNDYELVLGRGQIASCLFAGTVVVAIFAGGAYFAGKLSAMNCVAASNSIPQATAPLRVDSVVSQAGVPASGISQTGVPQTGVPQATAAPAPAQAAANSSVSEQGVAPTAIASGALKTAIVPYTVGAAGATPGTMSTTTSNTMLKTTNATAQVASAASNTLTIAPKANTSPETRESQTGAATLPDVKDSKGSALFANPQKGALYLQVGAVERGMATIIAEGLRQHGLVSFVAPGPTDRIFRVLVGPLANQDEYKRVKGQVDSIDVGNFARQFEK